MKQNSFPSVITFLGMSGVGKSTIGKHFSRQHGYTFIDLDISIESRIESKLQPFIDSQGEEALLKIEEEMLLEQPLPDQTVFSPGGSVVYSEKGMERLKKDSVIVLLSDTYDRLIKRINPENRGIIGMANKSYKEIFEERQSLYTAHADIVVEYPTGFNLKKVIQLVEEKLHDYHTKNT